MKKPLSKLERVPLREAWKHEANDFTSWLRGCLFGIHYSIGKKQLEEALA
jgi:hypothetical protein